MQSDGASAPVNINKNITICKEVDVIREDCVSFNPNRAEVKYIRGR